MASGWTKALIRPRTWLLLLAGLALLTVLDTFRSPRSQVTGRLWVLLVRGYQGVGRPLLSASVKCRYCPTCSDYSIEAVETHGIRRGLALSVRRISSCQATVPPDTFDPVPLPDFE